MITGRGKQCRLLGTVGVARGLGDHDLIVKSSLANCKEFLSCQPEVRVKYIQDLHPDSILVMATDGLWDVLTNLNVFDLTREFWARNKNDLFICQKLAQHLTLEARGEKTTDGYWEKKNGDLASGDDISCLAIPISKVASFINANQDVI